MARGSDFVWPKEALPPNVYSVSAQLGVADQVGFLSIDAYGAQDTKSVPKFGKPSVLGDGSVAYVSQEAGSSDGIHDDRIDLYVTLVRTDGSSLSVLETNGANAKSAAPTGAKLLLSSEQILAMIDSSAWDAALAAADMLPLSAQSPSTTASDASGNGAAAPGLDYR